MAVAPIKTPFPKMTYSPDIPSAALSPAEYNSGRNVETDLRGVKKVLGDANILSTIPGNIIYVTAGFRLGTSWHFVVATREGYWYDISSAGTSSTINPGGLPFTGYVDGLNITDAWNGEVLFLNDTLNPPMYYIPTETELRLYDSPPDNYVWNYNPSWTDLTAGFLRLFSAPNVGSVLIAGNLSYVESGTQYNLPNTVRWSNSFGTNSGPTTWVPQLVNVANELEVPVRGPVIDGFPLNGNFYVCSYWDTVVFSPIAFQTTVQPVFGVKLLNQGRGLLNENCWANADDTVYGLDARDIWVFNGGNFASLGNQRVKNYFYNNLNPTYSSRTFIVNNTNKNQIEIYYPDLNSTGFCNKMLGYRYDFDIWNPPRDVSDSVHAVESPRWSANVANLASRTVVYAQGNTPNSQLVQKDQGNSFLGNTAIDSEFRRDNISFGQPYSNKVQVHRILPEIVGTGNINVTVGGAQSVAANIAFKPTVSMPIQTNYPWTQINQNDQRVVSIKMGSNDATDTWETTAINWQVTIIEDDR